MKVAITHDYLNQYGGAERVLEALIEMFPDADLFTLLHDADKTLGVFEDHVKDTSFLDKPVIKENHRLFIPLMPAACNSINSDESYDLMISSAAGYGKGFSLEADYHVSYCHSPLRYAWEINEMKDFPNAPWALKQSFAKPIAEMLRRWDKRAADEVNMFMTNSNHIAQKVNSYYERSAEVVHPPVDLETFYKEDDTNQNDYYLMVGRLLYYKVFDLGIEAFNRLNKPLKIVGSGPEKKALKKKAGGNVEFVSNVTDHELRDIYNRAKALIFPQVEDFGLVAAEAQACGLPVISYRKGGGREIVEDGKSGLLFDHQTPEEIVSAVKKFEKINFDRDYISERGSRFSKSNFKEGVKEVLKQSGITI